jgi:hypothetical protein
VNERIKKKKKNRKEEVAIGYERDESSKEKKNKV